MGKANANASPAIQAENKTALKVFRKAKVSAAVKAITASRLAGEDAKAIGATAAMVFMTLTDRFIHDANEKGVTDSSTQLDNWLSNIKIMSAELVAEGHAAAEVLTDKEGNVTGSKLVGYAANVASTAKGVVEFGIDIEAVPTKDGQAVSYRDIAKAVTAERASRRPADVIALAESKQACKEAFDELLELVAKDDDVPIINALTTSLLAMKAQAIEDIATIDAMEKAEHDKAAEDAAFDAADEQKMAEEVAVTAAEAIAA